MIEEKISEAERLKEFMQNLGFEERDNDDGDDTAYWQELSFKFGGGKFELVVDEICGKMTIVVQLGGSCSEEITRKPFNLKNMTQIAQTWGLI